MPFLPPETSLFNARYTLQNPIGRGGFGRTYRALDERTGRVVAIKECFPAGCERHEKRIVPGDFASHECLERFREMFREQARRLGQIHHRAVVSLFDCFDENGTTYLVMELLEGPTLLEEVEKNGALDDERARKTIEEIADALRAIHEAGFLHLDIKPENVILVNGAPVLVDFDLMSARENRGFETRPLQLSAQIGTPGYAPLEQYASHAPLSPATDIYALGATFYHLLTGAAPISAVDRAAGVDLVSAKTLRAPIAPEWSLVLERSLELQSEKRPATTYEFLQILQTPIVESRDENDEDRPQFAAHAKGFYRVVLSEKNAVFPARCVCCYGKNPTEQWNLNSPSGKHVLPLCAMCARHHRLARQSGQVTFWGMGASLPLAFLGMYLSASGGSFWPIFLCLFALILCFGAMSYGALK